MPKHNSLRERIKRERRRRDKKPRPTPLDASPASDRVRERIVEHHLDVLQNIEFVLVDAYRSWQDIDDAEVYQAIRSELLKAEPSSPVSAELAGRLRVMRGTRSDVADDIWEDALRVVLSSVETHSTRSPEECSYLNFIDDFIV